jgi:hypothetical protein
MRRVAVGVVLLLMVGSCAGYAAETVHLSSTRTAPPSLMVSQLRLPAQPVFKLSSIAEMKTSIAILPVVVIGQPAGSTTTVVGTLPDPYNSGTGVVLDVCHPKHAATGSSLDLGGVNFTADFVSKLIANDPQTTASCIVDWAGPYANRIGRAIFQGLTPGQHTYLLTVGTTVPTANLSIGIYLPDTTWTSLPSSQLVANASTSEAKALISVTMPADGAAATRLIGVYLDVNPQPAQTVNGRYAVLVHHVQLARLD